MKHTIGILLGAGASKPFGVPTTGDMAKEYLKSTKNEYLKKIFTNENDTDIENVIKTVHQIKELPNNLGIQLLKKEGKDFDKVESMSQSCEETEKELSEFIRDKCLKHDIKNAIKIFEQIFQLQEIATIKIFSTNYDMIVEEVCRNLKIDLSDGFVSSQHEYQKMFNILSLNKGNIQLYKLHGSVNWWSDSSRQKIFNLDPDLKGKGKYTNLMIYPAEKDHVFNFPYNILQWFFSLTLNNLTELIAIGHKFGDPNITSTVKAALENPNFKLILVNRSASKIKKDIFDDHERVEAIDIKFEDWIPVGIKKLTKSAKEQNAKFDAIEEGKKAEKEKIKEAEEKIRELEQQNRVNETLNQDWTGSGIRITGNTFDPGDSVAENLMLGDDPSIPFATSNVINFGGNVGNSCPKCGTRYFQGTLTDGKCPNCGTSVGIV